MKYDYDEYGDLKRTSRKYEVYTETDDKFGVHPILWFTLAGYVALFFLLCYTLFF